MEVLELPLTNALTPISERAQSNGRFVAYDRGKEILDPAIFDEGTPITIVAEVVGTTAALQVDESKQEYPAFSRTSEEMCWLPRTGRLSCGDPTDIDRITCGKARKFLWPRKEAL